MTTRPSFLERSRGCTTIVDLLQLWSHERPDRPAYTFLPDGDEPPVSIGFAALDRRARAVAADLQARGGAGERALLLYANGLDFVEAFLGCLYAGAIPVPMPRPSPPFDKTLPRIRGIVRSSGARFLLASGSTVAARADIVARAPELDGLLWTANDAVADDRGETWCQPDSDDPLGLIQYTSGSTSSPRGVRVTQRNLLQSCAMMDRAWEHSESSVMVSWLPLFHDMGLVYGMLTPLFAGFHCVILTPQAFVRHPLRWLRAMSRYRGTHTIAPNFGYDLCVRRFDRAECVDLDLSTWRVAASGAEPVRKDTVSSFVETFRPYGLRPESMVTAYGLAESTLAVTSSWGHAFPAVVDLRRDDLEQDRVVVASPGEGKVRSLVSVGVPLADTTIAIVDPETCRTVGPARVGEIWIGGPTVAGGYLDLPEDSARTFEARIDGTGEGPFLRTGDLGFLRDGELYVCGRLKDLVILRGKSHHPVDLEATVEQCHPAVRLSAAVSVDDDGLEELVLVVELERNVDKADLRSIEERIRREVALHHEIEPREVVFVKTGTIPKTSSGKIKRGEVRRARADGTLTTPKLAATRPLSPEVAPLRPGSPAETPVSTPSAEPASLSRLESGRRPESPVAELGSDLRAEVARLARRPSVGDDVVLNQLGLDSVKLAELAVFLERRFGLVVPMDVLLGEVTIGAIAARLRSLSRSEPAVVAAPVVRPRRAPSTDPGPGGLDFSLFFFANDGPVSDENRYRLLVESARLVDTLGFRAVWIPERHFHPFGGVFPNPAVAAAALATITSRIRLRAGSVVLPLHDPLRVAEEWSLVDNLSNGRVDLAFASGWAANDFVLMPQNFADRRKVNLDGMDTVKRLWAGEAETRHNGVGEPFAARVFPQPVQAELTTWLTCTGGIDGFVEAGSRGHNVLTALLFQTVEELGAKLSVYRAARAAHGHDPAAGIVTVMLHTFVGATVGAVRNVVRGPFTRYLRSSIDLWRNDFPQLAGLAGPEQDAAVDAAFERYASRNSLFGTPATCLETVAGLRAVGVGEIACLIDFGVETGAVLEALGPLDELRRLARDPA